MAGYSKRKKITLTGGASGAQTDFQLKLTVTYDGDMQSDFDDLRFTQADGTTLIDAWLETKTDDVSATVWAEFPMTPANTVDADYYMYYGKVVANYWDIAATFVHGDDFEDGSISAAWSQECTDGSRTITETSGKLTVDVSNYNADWWSSVNTAPKVFQSISLSDGYEIVIKLDSNSDMSYNQSGVGVTESTNHQSGIKLFKGYVTVDTVMSQYLGGDISRHDTSQDTNILLKIRKATDWYFYYDLTGAGWNALGSRTQTINGNEVVLYTATAQASGSQTGDFHYFYIKKYAANPPTYAFGSEESASLKELTTTIAAITSTSAPNVLMLRELISTIDSTTSISVADINVLRELTSTIATATLLSEIELLTAEIRELVATIATSTATSTSDLNILREIESTIGSTTATSTPVMAILREIISTITSETSTSTIDINVLRELIATITTTTSASDIELLITAIRELTTTIAASTSTSSPSMVVLRELDLTLATTTATVADLKVLRELSSTIAIQTALSDISLIVGELLELSATVAAITSTSTPDLKVLREMEAIIAAATALSVMELLVSVWITSNPTITRLKSEGWFE